MGMHVDGRKRRLSVCPVLRLMVDLPSKNLTCQNELAAMG